jgi:hypothetical protein
MSSKGAKRPRDPAQLAKLIVDIATGAALVDARGLGLGARVPPSEPSTNRRAAVR